jgi:hypothetical protein
MKFSTAIVAISMASASAFAPSDRFARKTVKLGMNNGMDTSGNSWKPDSEKMGVSIR